MGLEINRSCQIDTQNCNTPPGSTGNCYNSSCERGNQTPQNQTNQTVTYQGILNMLQNDCEAIDLYNPLNYTNITCIDECQLRGKDCIASLEMIDYRLSNGRIDTHFVSCYHTPWSITINMSCIFCSIPGTVKSDRSKCQGTPGAANCLGVCSNSVCSDCVEYCVGLAIVT